MEVQVLFGLCTWEKSEKREFGLRETEAFQQAVISNLSSNGFNVDKLIE